MEAVFMKLAESAAARSWPAARAISMLGFAVAFSVWCIAKMLAKVWGT